MKNKIYNNERNAEDVTERIMIEPSVSYRRFGSYFDSNVIRVFCFKRLQGVAPPFF